MPTDAPVPTDDWARPGVPLDPGTVAARWTEDPVGTTTRLADLVGRVSAAPVEEASRPVRYDALASHEHTWFLRGLPNARAIADAERDGPAYAAAVGRWASVVRSLRGGPETLDAHADLDFYGSTEWEEILAHRLGDCRTDDTRRAAVTLRTIEGHAAPACRREWAHRLEDAVVSMALLDAGVRVGFATFREAGRPLPRWTTVEAAFLPRGGRVEAASSSEATALRRLRGLEVPYHRSPAFLALADRPMRHVAHPEQAFDAMVDLARTSDRCFVKSVTMKACWVVDLRGVRDRDDAAHAALRALGRSVALREDHWARDTLVQGFRPPTHERRYFMAHGRVIARTPSDRSLDLTHVWRGDGDDPRVARIVRPAEAVGNYDRGEQTSVVDRAMAARMDEVAERFGAAVASEAVFDRATGGLWVLDVGYDRRGPFAVEVNGAVRAGCYAFDAEAFARGVAEWVQERRRREAAVMTEAVRRMPGGHESEWPGWSAVEPEGV